MFGLNFSRIAKEYGLKFIPYSDLAGTSILSDKEMGSSGWLSVIRNKAYILFDDTKSKPEIFYTLAHELGHYLLGHLTYRNPSTGGLSEKYEQEADIFAAVLTAFSVLLQFCDGADGQREGLLSASPKEV